MAKEGIFIIIILMLIASIFILIFNKLTILIIFILIAAFVGFFFRDPERIPFLEKGVILSPADGKMIKVEKINDNSFANENSIKISIFLSLYDVHVNRSPVEGIVEKIVYKKGKFFPAYKGNASDLNEQNVIHIKGEKERIILKQIAGILARRIKCYLKENQKVLPGERIGLIMFGSRVELFLPASVNLLVKEGDKVKGGKTIIGRFE
ncbi:MAG: phosphatidylserine decarboxylase family protein [Acidobacteriota bacterium]